MAEFREATGLQRPQLIQLQQTGGVFAEIPDVKWVNPREFHRKALSYVEDLGYHVDRESDQDIRVEKEQIGEKTGLVRSSLTGVKQIMLPAHMQWTPYQMWGIGLVIAGVVLLFISMAMFGESVGGGFILLWLALGVGAGGVWVAMYEKNDQFSVSLLLKQMVLAEGEASERTITRPGGTVTDLFAQLAVTYGANVYLRCSRDGFSNPQFKNELEKQVNEKIGKLRERIGTEAQGTPFSEWPVAHSPFQDFMGDEAKGMVAQYEQLMRGDFERLKGQMENYRVDIERTTSEMSGA